MQTNRPNTGALIGGAIFIAFGLLSLVGQVFRALNWGLLWAIIVMGGLAATFACAWLRHARDWARVATIALAALAVVSVFFASYAEIF